MKIIYYDLETTGLDPKRHGIHQLSGIIVINGVVKCDFALKMQPFAVAEIEPEALKCSNTTPEMLQSYPSMGLVYYQFVDMLGKYANKFDKQDKFFLIGYNNRQFDDQFLRNWFFHNNDKYFGSWFWSNTIDVMVLASQYLMHQRQLMPDFKLKTVAAACGITVDESKLHQAGYDIELTKQIYDCITSKSTENADTTMHGS